MSSITEEEWRTVATVLMLLTAVPIVAFVANYFLRFKWYKNSAGWNMLLFMAVVGEFLLLALYDRLPGKDFPEWFRALAWLQLAPLAWWRLMILIEVEIKQRRDRRLKSDD